jgi:hypothetical protein
MSHPLFRALHARFDSNALRAPQLSDATGITHPQPALRAAIHAWCVQGLQGPPQASLQLAVLAGAPSRAKSAWAADMALRLDGSYALQAAGNGVARLALRLRVKAQDAAWWRPRRASDFWDCGYLQTSADAQAHLRRFVPRRATLVLLDNVPAAAALGAAQTLWQNQAGFTHPVRMLLLADTSTDAPAADWLAWAPSSTVWHWT